MNYDKIYKYSIWIIGIALGIATIKILWDQTKTNPWFILQFLGVGALVYFYMVIKPKEDIKKKKVKQSTRSNSE